MKCGVFFAAITEFYDDVIYCVLGMGVTQA